MTKKLAGILAACISLLCIACGAYWEEKGMFSEIEKEIKLEKPDVVGNILSIVESGGILYAAGGVVYCKNANAIRGWSKFSNSPYGQVVRLKVDPSGEVPGLYALCAYYEDYRIYRYAGVWVPVDISKKNAIFPPIISTPDGAYTADVAASASGKSASVTALYMFDNYLYVGTIDGVGRLSISGGSLGGWQELPGINAESSFTGWVIGAVYARQTGSRTDIYVSVIGRTQAQGSDKNGLWCWYGGGYDNTWNRE